MINVPVPLSCRKPRKTSCSTMDLRIRLFTIDVQTFQMVSTSPVPMYSPPPFGIRTFFFHIKASGMYPSQNAACVTLTTFSHVLVSVSFSLAADLNHSLRCSAFIPNGPPALPDQSFLTAAAIPLTSGGPSAILTGCTRIGSVSPFGGRYM